MIQKRANCAIHAKSATSKPQRIINFGTQVRKCCQKTVACDLQQPKNDDCFTLCTKNEQIARYTRHQRPQNRSGSSTLKHKCVSVVEKQRKPTSSNPKMTSVSHFAPRTSKSHDTRDISDLKTAAVHQLWKTSV